MLAQHLGDRQHHVGGGGAGRDLAGQLEADDPRDEHRHRLAEHGRLGLDAADAPAQHAEAVDHGGVRVGADAACPGRPEPVPRGHDHAGQVLDVDLVHDAGARRHDLELVERGLAPAQELVALAVALVLEVDVALERVRRVPNTSTITEWSITSSAGASGLTLVRVAAELGDRLAHGGQVDDAGHAGEVLHDHPGRGELDLGVRLGGRVPAGQRADVVGGDVRAVLGAQQVLQQHLEAEREALGTRRRPTAGRSRARPRRPAMVPLAPKLSVLATMDCPPGGGGRVRLLGPSLAHPALAPSWRTPVRVKQYACPVKPSSRRRRVRAEVGSSSGRGNPEPGRAGCEQCRRSTISGRSVMAWRGSSCGRPGVPSLLSWSCCAFLGGTGHRAGAADRRRPTRATTSSERSRAAVNQRARRGRAAHDAARRRWTAAPTICRPRSPRSGRRPRRALVDLQNAQDAAAAAAAARRRTPASRPRPPRPPSTQARGAARRVRHRDLPAGPRHRPARPAHRAPPAREDLVARAEFNDAIARTAARRAGRAGARPRRQGQRRLGRPAPRSRTTPRAPGGRGDGERKADGRPGRRGAPTQAARAQAAQLAAVAAAAGRGAAPARRGESSDAGLRDQRARFDDWQRRLAAEQAARERADGARRGRVARRRRSSAARRGARCHRPGDVAARACSTCGAAATAAGRRTGDPATALRTRR